MKTDRIQGIIIPEALNQSNFISSKLKKLTTRIKTVKISMPKIHNQTKSVDFSPKISRKHVDREVEDLIKRLRIRDY